MASPSLYLSPISFKINPTTLMNMKHVSAHVNVESSLFQNLNWSFKTGSRILIKPPPSSTFNLHPNSPKFSASWLSPEFASNAFTWSTLAVFPCYSLMVFAPKAELTKRSMESNVPYVILGLVYAHLLYLSWTPDTLRLIFASKYFLPELPSIAKLFSSELTLASAWVHWLVVDLFAARQVFMDGLEEKIENSTFCDSMFVGLSNWNLISCHY